MLNARLTSEILAINTVMTTLSESLREARRPIGLLAAPKLTTMIGNGNVRTMYVTGAAAQVAKEIRVQNRHTWYK